MTRHRSYETTEGWPQRPVLERGEERYVRTGRIGGDKVLEAAKFGVFRLDWHGESARPRLKQPCRGLSGTQLTLRSQSSAGTFLGRDVPARFSTTRAGHEGGTPPSRGHPGFLPCTIGSRSRSGDAGFPVGHALRRDVPTLMACQYCAETGWDVSTVPLQTRYTSHLPLGPHRQRQDHPSVARANSDELVDGPTLLPLDFNSMTSN